MLRSTTRTVNHRLLGALAYLSREERAYLNFSAKQAQAVENQWTRRFHEYLRDLDEQVFASLHDHGRFDSSDIDFLPLVLEHSVRVMEASITDAQRNPTGRRLPNKLSALSGPPQARTPKSLQILKELWDKWRRKKDIPPRQKAIAERIRKAYLKRVQSVWEKHGKDFREGKVFSPEKVREVLRIQGDMAKARVGTIVQTETTYYYNKARRNLYDQSPDVTHYLFVAIRDQATTKWCKSRQGIVYAKGDPLLEDETPPIHWRCRSEILPLTPQNPRHLKLIEDKSRARRHNQCAPLPSGWKRRAA